MIYNWEHEEYLDWLETQVKGIMTDDEREEFNEMMEGLIRPQGIEIAEIAEVPCLTEITVPVGEFAHPEVRLMEAITAYMEENRRRPLLAINLAYSMLNPEEPQLTAILIQGQPLEGE